jgi:uncharacterized protein YuzE
VRVTYDPQVDALAIDLADAPTESVRELAPGVSGDFDKAGRLTSIEILSASRRYPIHELRKLDDGADWLTLPAAAKEAKLSANTLRHQLNAGRLQGRKVGRDWQVSRAALWTYLESRASSGRRAKSGARRILPRKTSGLPRRSAK